MDVHKNARTTPHSRALTACRAAAGQPAAAVARVLQRLGLARLRALETPRPARRYEWAQPGPLLHLDTKQLGAIGRIGHRITGDRRTRVCGIGWEYVHVAVDDGSRLACAEVLPDEHGATIAGLLRRAVAWDRQRDIQVQRVLSDDGAGYRSRVVAAVARALAVAQRSTRPDTPRTNGPAERFIQTLLREWAYARPYASSAQRTAALGRWLHDCNGHRRHAALNGQPPVSRVAAGDNLLRLHG